MADLAMKAVQALVEAGAPTGNLDDDPGPPFCYWCAARLSEEVPEKRRPGQHRRYRGTPAAVHHEDCPWRLVLEAVACV